MRFTSDDEIVLRHDWTQVDLGQPEFEYLQQIERQPSEYLQEQIPREYLPTLEQFKQARILSKYTPLSFRDVVDWMKSHSDAYMVLDVKEDEYIPKVNPLLQISPEIHLPVRFETSDEVHPPLSQNCPETKSS